MIKHFKVCISISTLKSSTLSFGRISQYRNLLNIKQAIRLWASIESETHSLPDDRFYSLTAQGTTNAELYRNVSRLSLPIYKRGRFNQFRVFPLQVSSESIVHWESRKQGEQFDVCLSELGLLKQICCRVVA